MLGTAPDRRQGLHPGTCRVTSHLPLSNTACYGQRPYPGDCVDPGASPKSADLYPGFSRIEQVFTITKSASDISSVKRTSWPVGSIFRCRRRHLTPKSTDINFLFTTRIDRHALAPPVKYRDTGQQANKR